MKLDKKKIVKSKTETDKFNGIEEKPQINIKELKTKQESHSQQLNVRTEHILNADGNKNGHPNGNNEKLNKEEKHTQRLEMTTGKVLNMAESEMQSKVKSNGVRNQYFQVTTERVLKMVQKARKNEASRSVADQNPLSNRRNGKIS